jgi:hypothetical protein
MKDLKPSTRQRFVSLEFKYPEEGAETAIVAQESGVDQELARRLVKLGHMTRNLKERGLDEGASTRLLIHAGKLIRSGIDSREACRAAITNTLTDDEEMQISMSGWYHHSFSHGLRYCKHPENDVLVLFPFLSTPVLVSLRRGPGAVGTGSSIG